MPQIQISANGIEKLLKSLNPYKAADPDHIKPIDLQTLHAELSLILQVIFKRFLAYGKRQMCPSSFKKVTSQTLQNIAKYLSHVFYAKWRET